MRRFARRLGRIAIVVVVALLALEGVLRFMGARLSRKYEAEIMRPLAQRDCLTFLTVGESTSKGLWVEAGQSYPRQLADLLTRRYGRPICSVTPVHFGQNTSQMYNRFDLYMDTFKPRLIIFMCGANNTWSLEESNIGWFIDLTNPDLRWLRMRLVLDRSRVFKLARMAKYGLGSWRAMARDDLRGRAEVTPWPPPDENVQFGTRNQRAFLELWKYEVGRMIDKARAKGVPSILMTYPNYYFPAATDFQELAAAKDVPLVRNDLLFKPFLAPGLVEKYFFPDQGHPREIGYRLMAEEVARLIEERDLLRLGRPATGSNPPR
jgi:GDSL-like lipase/acylhydrolase family protein